MMENKTFSLGFTKSQVLNLIDFIEINFIDSIRRDPDIDNIDYIMDMMDVLRILRKEMKLYHDTEER